MKWLSLLFSFILGKINSTRPPSFKEMVLVVLEEVTYRSRKPVLLLLSGLACILILCGGFFMSIIDFTSQFDREGHLYFTASNASGVALVIIALSIFFWIFTSAWPGTRESKTPEREFPAQAAASSLEQALSLLVMDFIKEREYKREHQERHQEKEPPPLNGN